jgi:hypothetical protein
MNQLTEKIESLTIRVRKLEKVHAREPQSR